MPPAAPTPCPGCTLSLTPVEGPTHAYIGASPACWRLYGDVLAREYGEYRYPDCHRHTVDTYAVQHPGTPSRRAVRSVAVHLVSLHLLLEQGAAPDEATRRMAQLLRRGPGFRWLDPPEDMGPLTIADVASATDLASHRRAVLEWAASVWHAWRAHHPTVRAWAGR